MWFGLAESWLSDPQTAPPRQFLSSCGQQTAWTYYSCHSDPLLVGCWAACFFPCAATSVQDMNLVLAVSPCQQESYLFLFSSDNRVDLFSSVVLSSGRKVTTCVTSMVRSSSCSWQREVDPAELFPLGLLSCGSSP